MDFLPQTFRHVTNSSSCEEWCQNVLHDLGGFNTKGWMEEIPTQKSTNLGCFLKNPYGCFQQ